MSQAGQAGLSTSSATRDPGSEGAQRALEQEDAVQLVKSVFKATWTEFYAWERDDGLRMLHSLARMPSPSVSPSSPFSLPASSTDEPGTNWSAHTAADGEECCADEDELLLDNDGMHIDSGSRTFTVCTFSSSCSSPSFPSSEHAIPSSKHTLMPELLAIAPPPDAPTNSSPPYEICTPTSRNINVGDDSEDMPFIAYADDPEFHLDAHIADYKRFAWQKENQDPDLEVIVFKTAHILYYEHGLSLNRIDNTGVMPLKLLGAKGVVRSSRHRDFPDWGEIRSCQLSLPYEPSYANVGPRAIVSSLVQDFCNNMNCLLGYCTVHMGEFSISDAIPPTVANKALINNIEAECSSDCFILGHGPPIESVWTQQDLELLDSVLRYSPDISPCDLAIICRKPCYEVFKYRKMTFPDGLFEKPVEKARSRPVRAATLQFHDHDSSNFTPNWPCSHDGPCDVNSQCPCFLNHSHCESSCRCSTKCTRRWAGCNCGKSKTRTTCQTWRCPCYVAHRECDPILCLKCEARDHKSDVCRNVSLQRQRCKRTQVREGKWGIGLFLAEAVDEGELILEYTGELIYEITSICRDLLARHRGRSYLFQLNSTISVDSSKAGNESRFINHDAASANCYAGVRMVNGEHRIGIFAFNRVEAGTELFLNYGDSFFRADDAEESSSTPSETLPSIGKGKDVYNMDQHSSDETYTESESS